MFSSLASFLPSALHINSSSGNSNSNDTTTPQELPQSSFDPTTDDEDENDPRLSELQHQQGRLQQQQQQPAQQQVVSKKEKEQKLANETFIFVRPPPSKSNHPLNLQVQLVPPNARPPSGVVPPEAITPTSASSVGTDGGASLTRSSSNRSSNYTNYAASSTASFSSVASSASSNGTNNSRRTIIPLYNLQAHNVLTNVIVDAGTDAKIAKFQKRGLELIDLAILEPVEVWGERHRGKEARREGMRLSVDEMGTVVSVTPLTPLPSSNRTSLVSARSLAGFLQATTSRTTGTNSRPATPSASSSAVSLHSSNLSHSQQGHAQTQNPQFLVSPPNSAAQHQTFQQASQYQPSQTPLDSQSTTPVPPSAVTPVPHFAGPTPSPSPSTKKSNLFSKLKFNKRNSALNPLTTTKEEPKTSGVTSAPTSPQGASASSDKLAAFAAFAMAPLIPGDLGHRVVHQPGDEPSKSTPSKKPPADISLLSPPTSPTSQQTTPTQAQPSTPTQLLGKDREDDEPVSPTPTVAPSRFGIIGGAAGGSGGGHSRNLSLTSAITSSLKGGKIRLNAVLGDKKAASVAPPVQPSPLADSNVQQQQHFVLGNSGEGSSGSSISANRNGNVKGSRRDSGSVDSLHSNGNNNSPFKSGGLLHHSNSQQFIGAGSPHYAAHQQPSQQQPPQLQSKTSDPQLPGTPVTLRQLQLRPPVLGIQPTFVSASSSYCIQSHADPSSTSLASNAYHHQNEESMGSNLREIESRSTTVESRERKPSASGRPSSTIAKNIGKEKALMYVWLVRKWLKRRGNGQDQGGGLWNGLVGEGSGGLFSSGGAFGGAGAAGKRESWHGPSGGGHQQRASSSSAQGQSNSLLGLQFHPMQSIGSIVGGGFEVRLEWKRARAKGSKRGRRRDRESKKRRGSVSASAARAEEVTEKEAGKKEGDREASAVSQRAQKQDGETPKVGGAVAEASPQKMTILEKRRLNRMSGASFNSATEDGARNGSPARGSPSRPGTMGSSTGKKRLSLILKRGVGGEDEDGTEDNADADAVEDEGEESDSEDSETPWVCTLKIRRMTQSSGLTTYVGNVANAYAGKDSKGDKENSLRLKVGTLSPTPHHPKVVAMLKVPFPLPDIEVERMGVVKRRGVGPASAESQGPSAPPYNGLILTAEEIKDIVCSTGLWLVVREGFGGVGKVSRKGDGWKIRG